VDEVFVVGERRSPDDRGYGDDDHGDAGGAKRARAKPPREWWPFDVPALRRGVSVSAESPGGVSVATRSPAE
jgi:hypothetical protein